MATTAERVLRALEAHNLKREADGSYRCNSPFRPGSDSGAFCVQVDADGEHGAFYDHVSGEGGSLYTLARRLGVALPQVAPAHETKRAYTGRADFARAHGAPDEAFAAAKWGEVIKDNRPALEFPTHTGTRWRFLDGRRPHYKSPPGYRRCWYGLNGGFFRLAASGAPLVVCNGEASVVAAQHHGLAALCVTAGEHEVPAALLADLVAELKGARPPVVVALDCDATGRKTALMVKAQFEAAGFQARAVDLGLTNGGDLADFCALHAGDVLAALLARPDLPPATSETDDHYRFLSLGDVLAQPPLEWLVKGVIPKRALAMVYGQSGSHKTFFVLAIAYDLAFSVPVVYVASEGGAGMRQRLEALIKHHGGRVPSELTFVQGTVDLFDGAAAARFRARLEALARPPALLVVDTFAGSTGDADENKGRDMNRILANLGQMTEALGATVLLVHHTNKGGRQERGHGALFARCDTVIRLSRLDDVTLVESHKAKDAQGFEPYALREVVVPLGYRNADGDEVTSLVLLPADQVMPASGTLTAKQRALLELIQVGQARSYAEIADIIEARNKMEVHRMVKNLIHRGLARRTADGWLELTPAGEAALTDEQPSRNSVTGVTWDSGKPRSSEVEKYAVTAVTGVTGEGSLPRHEQHPLAGFKSDYYRAGL